MPEERIVQINQAMGIKASDILINIQNSQAKIVENYFYIYSHNRYK